MRHIGILAHSADGAALCFLEMVREASRRLGPHQHPEIAFSILPMGSTLEHYERNDLATVRAHLTATAPRLAAAGGIALRTPAPADRALVVFEEVTQGRLEDGSRAEFVRIIDNLKGEGCDAVALSCTEIPLLITPIVSPLPTLDSTRLLAHAAVAAALGERTP